MNQDLKIIKNKYGENMMHLCREFFPILLEKEGLLSQILLDNFAISHDLYQDLVDNKMEDEFKNFVYSLVDVQKSEITEINKNPQELMEEAGYNLYCCSTEEEIKRFKKYYAKGEELCTFRGGRLNTNVVFFAVKKDVDKIKREDFQNPTREDLYGTSVISIQFSKDGTNTLSIKNRYNHRVNNPDATFSNNLDNIIPGLTESFEKYYGLVQSNRNKNFSIPNYVRANDGKFYKYNYEIDNVYYCPNNIIIDNFNVKRYEKEKYIIADYFIIDLQNKMLTNYNYIKDSFKAGFSNITKIDVKTTETGKVIYFTSLEGDIIEIELDKRNRIIGYKNNNLKYIGNNFLFYNETIEYLELPNVKSILDDFLYHNEVLESLSLPQVLYIGDDFLNYNKALKNLSLPKVERIGEYFLGNNKVLQSLFLPELKYAGDCFLYNNEALKILSLPKLEFIRDYFLHNNEVLQSLFLPKVIHIGGSFLFNNKALKSLSLPELENIGYSFLHDNKVLKNLSLPKVEYIGEYFMFCNSRFKGLELEVGKSR